MCTYVYIFLSIPFYYIKGSEIVKRIFGGFKILIQKIVSEIFTISMNL